MVGVWILERCFQVSTLQGGGGSCLLIMNRERELKRRLVNEGRGDERLKPKVEESTYLGYTGFHDKTN